jgi:kumamolisin
MSAKERRVSLKTSTRSLLSGSKQIGPTDAAEQIQVTVRVRRGSSPSEFPSDAELGSGLPGQRNYLTREEFAVKHGARAADIAAIRTFAAENGLQVARVEAARRTVILGGTVETLSKAFGTELRHYSYQDRTYRCRTGALEIPADRDQKTFIVIFPRTTDLPIPN